MIWIILAALGVPLWLCAVAILTLLLRNRTLRGRPGNVPVRLRRPGKSRWTRGHGVWIHDVFAFRGSPAAWSEALLWVSAATPRPLDEQERRKLRRLGDHPVVATFDLTEGGSAEVASKQEYGQLLLGPFGVGRPVDSPTH